MLRQHEHWCPMMERPALVQEGDGFAFDWRKAIAVRCTCGADDYNAGLAAELERTSRIDLTSPEWEERLARFRQSREERR